jgi:adenylate cyclase
MRAGQVLRLGDGNEFVLEGQASGSGLLSKYPSARGATAVNCDAIEVTILVGDIRDYTRLVACFSARAVQAGLSRVFRCLETEVAEHGGTVKEYEGDAIFAFWEERPDTNRAAAACRAALALHRTAERLGQDPEIWGLPVPLQLDWALTSGPVVVMSHGEYSPMGLSMTGASVPLAFRLEKLADQETGPIVVCERTRKLAGDAFEFRDLGSRPVKGIETPPRVFALLREWATAEADR